MRTFQSVFGLFFFGTVFMGCTAVESGSLVNEAIDEANNPNRVNGLTENFEGKLDSLPQAGELSSWYMGDAYVFTSEGTARRDSSDLSPIEKYDAAFNSGSWRATEWEREFHGTHGGTKQRLSWEGHCNGMAAAIVTAPEPKKSVTINGITFSAGDVKALLAEVMFGVPTQLAGKRCNEDSPESDCRDLNPGSFHVGVANMIGIKKQKPIIDVSYGISVWNAPIRSYTVKKQERISASQAQGLAGGSGSEYTFNRSATHFAHVRMDIVYVYGADKRASYEYVLELNASGRILGGEWVGASVSSHPDFMWFPGDPRQRSSGNPHIEFSAVKKLIVGSL